MDRLDYYGRSSYKDYLSDGKNLELFHKNFMLYIISENRAEGRDAENLLKMKNEAYNEEGYLRRARGSKLYVQKNTSLMHYGSTG